MALGEQDKEVLEKGKPSMAKRQGGGVARPGPGVADYLTGENKDFIRDLEPHLPQELVGGSLPHIPGTEEEAVWNAASQACATEKVHFCYSIDDGRIWYLACPSSTLASNPNSWCPLAAALPGNSEYWDRETVYLYEQEGVASALRWDPETKRMQVFLGASRTILPRVQSMDANFVTVNAEAADIVPWRNKTLKTEKLSRATAKMLVLSGMLVAIIAGLILIFSYLSVNMLERNLEDVKLETESASMQLIKDANSAMQNDAIRHMVRIQELLDAMASIDGTLVKYEVEKSAVTWEVLVPQVYALNVMQNFGGAIDDKRQEKDGRVRIRGSR